MSKHPITLYKDTELSIKFTVKQNGIVIDLTGSRIVFKVCDLKGDETINKEITESSVLATVGRITYAEKGVFYVTFTDTDTSEIYKGTYSLRWFIDASESANVLISGTPCEVPNFEICRVQ